MGGTPLNWKGSGEALGRLPWKQLSARPTKRKSDSAVSGICQAPPHVWFCYAPDKGS